MTPRIALVLVLGCLLALSLAYVLVRQGQIGGGPAPAKAPEPAADAPLLSSEPVDAAWVAGRLATVNDPARTADERRLAMFELLGRRDHGPGTVAAGLDFLRTADTPYDLRRSIIVHLGQLREPRAFEPLLERFAIAQERNERMAICASLTLIESRKAIAAAEARVAGGDPAYAEAVTMLRRWASGDPGGAGP